VLGDGLQAITEIGCEFITKHKVPQMIIRPPRVQPGKFVLAEAKKTLQHYRHQPDVPTALRDARSQG